MNPDYRIVPVRRPKLGVVGMLAKDVKPTDEVLDCEYYELNGAIYEIWPGSTTAVKVAGESQANILCAKCVQGIEHWHGSKLMPKRPSKKVEWKQGEKE